MLISGINDVLARRSIPGCAYGRASIFKTFIGKEAPRLARLACADQQTLLILDNFEQVLDAAPLVADLLSSVGTFRVLATSRAPLRLRGARVN